MDNIKTKYKADKIIISDFSKMATFTDNISKNLSCQQIYNFNISNGRLETGIGVSEFTCYAANDLNSNNFKLNLSALQLEHIEKVMYFKQYFPSSNQTTHRLLIYGSDKKLYLYQLFANVNNANWLYQLQFENVPEVLGYKKEGVDSILISSTDKLVVWTVGKAPYELENVPTITSMCVYNDELYCTIADDAEKIWYTSNLDPESVGTESEHTKYLILDGKAGGGKKIVVLKENMYVFCDYGIYRLNTYAKSEPTLHLVYLFNSQISPNTVVLCGDEVMFVTREGLYKFNGTTVEPINQLKRQLKNSFNDYAVATFLKDCYYLATSLDYDDRLMIGCEGYGGDYLKNNSIIKLNIYDYTYEIIRGVDVENMLALKAGVEEKVVLTFNSMYRNKIGQIDNGGVYFDEPYSRFYTTNYIVPEDMERVTITAITLEADEGITIGVEGDGNYQYFNTYTSGRNCFKTSISGNKFKIKIIANRENSYVDIMQLDYIKSK